VRDIAALFLGGASSAQACFASIMLLEAISASSESLGTFGTSSAQETQRGTVSDSKPAVEAIADISQSFESHIEIARYLAILGFLPYIMSTS
jgi:hypothetical protein